MYLKGVKNYCPKCSKEGHVYFDCRKVKSNYKIWVPDERREKF